MPYHMMNLLKPLRDQLNTIYLNTKKPNVINVGQSFDFKAWLNSRLPNVESWTDNLCYRFSKGPDGTTQLHYKFLCNTEQYFCKDHTCAVKSFKAVARETLVEPDTAVKFAGITMPMGIPTSIPIFAANLDFTLSNQVQNTEELGSSVTWLCR